VTVVRECLEERLRCGGRVEPPVGVLRVEGCCHPPGGVFCFAVRWIFSLLMSLLTAGEAMGVFNEAGNPISDRILLATCADCGRQQTLAHATYVEAEFIGGLSAYRCKDCGAVLLEVAERRVVPLTP